MIAQTGHLKNMEFVVDLQDSFGNSILDYPRNYDIREGFEFEGITYEPLTDEVLAALLIEDYTPRLQAFIGKVKLEHPTFSYDLYEFPEGENPVEYNPTLCPIGVVAEE